MILEVGAGGTIMITPPAKGSRLDKALNGDNGSVVDIGSGCSVYMSERTLMGKRMCVCGVEITTGPRPGGGYQPQVCNCIGKPPGGAITHYMTYDRDIHVLDPNGNPKRDANGNWLYLHRRGDRVLDKDGDPIVVNKETRGSRPEGSALTRPELKGSLPSAVFLAGLSNDQFEELCARVEAERQRRNCLAVARL